MEQLLHELAQRTGRPILRVEPTLPTPTARIAATPFDIDAARARAADAAYDDGKSATKKGRANLGTSVL
jgi:hypothetical protein